MPMAGVYRKHCQDPKIRNPEQRCDFSITCTTYGDTSVALVFSIHYCCFGIKMS